MKEKTWLDEIFEANERFLERNNLDKLITKRSPGTYAIVTCMDPRINLEAIGIAPLGNKVDPSSQVRIIRTVGGAVEPRSIVVARYLAGLKELTIMMHTDCGNSLAYKKIDILVENMIKQLEPERLKKFRTSIGEPFRERLLDWLKAFEDPQKAVKREVEDLRNYSIIPKDLVIHGLVYDVFTGKISVVVNGYA
jgi:carbonic anhydrase